MKFVRVISRLALVSLAAAVFIGLTAIYGRSAHPPLPNPDLQDFRRHRASAPELSRFPEFVAEVVTVAIFLVAGRIVLRLRLTPTSLSEEQPILLNWQRGRRNAKA